MDLKETFFKTEETWWKKSVFNTLNCYEIGNSFCMHSPLNEFLSLSRIKHKKGILSFKVVVSYLFSQCTTIPCVMRILVTGKPRIMRNACQLKQWKCLFLSMQGDGDQKIAKFCPRSCWMPLKTNALVAGVSCQSRAAWKDVGLASIYLIKLFSVEWTRISRALIFCGPG